jgi:hypothetical protein
VLNGDHLPVDLGGFQARQSPELDHLRGRAIQEMQAGGRALLDEIPVPGQVLVPDENRESVETQIGGLLTVFGVLGWVVGLGLAMEAVKVGAAVAIFTGRMLLEKNEQPKPRSPKPRTLAESTAIDKIRERLQAILNISH